MERYRVAVVNDREYAFQIGMCRSTIRKLLTDLLGVDEKEIKFKPGTYIIGYQKRGAKNAEMP